MAGRVCPAATTAPAVRWRRRSRRFWRAAHCCLKHRAAPNNTPGRRSTTPTGQAGDNSFPIVCTACPTSMVTISGLYAVTADCRDTDELLRKVDQALAGGARIVQYRNKTADPTARLVQARALAVLCQRHHVPLIVNDSVEIALLAGADGVHLGRDDGEVGAARALLGERLIGVSCYDRIDHALAAQRAVAAYLAFAAAVPCPTKP